MFFSSSGIIFKVIDCLEKNNSERKLIGFSPVRLFLFVDVDIDDDDDDDDVFVLSKQILIAFVSFSHFESNQIYHQKTSFS